MTCGVNTGCNHDCNQGRACPSQRTYSNRFMFWLYSVAVMALIAIAVTA
jgi:hypothetical protein